MPTVTAPAASATLATRTRSRATNAGRVLTGLLAAFLVVDSAGKLAQIDSSVEATTALGFTDGHVPLVGMLLAVGLVAHLMPRTAFLGAVYLTAYFGGAVAAHVRVENTGSAIFTAAFCAAVWIGYALREPRVRALVG